MKDSQKWDNGRSFILETPMLQVLLKKSLMMVFTMVMCACVAHGQMILPMAFPQQAQRQTVTPRQIDEFMANAPEHKRQQIIDVFFSGLIVAIQSRNIADMKFLADITPIIRKYDANFETHVAKAQKILGNATPMYEAPLPSFPSYNVGNKSQRKCSLCNGRGWRGGFRTPVYAGCSTSKRWCRECNEMVGASHSHERCPSCGGKGYY